jgi:hypothetical protein
MMRRITMKKVFSVERFAEVLRKEGYTEGYIEMCLYLFGNDCNGLTKEELIHRRFATQDAWMIEVEDDNERACEDK